MYPIFPSGFQKDLPLDSLHPHCIPGSLRSIQSNGQIEDMSLKKSLDQLYQEQVESPHKWSVSQRGNMTKSATRSLCCLEGVLSTLTRLSRPFPSSPVWQPRKGQGRPKEGLRMQPMHTNTLRICSSSTAPQKDHLGNNFITVVIHQESE